MPDRGDDLAGVLQEYYRRLALQPAPDLRARVLAATETHAARERGRRAVAAAVAAVAAVLILIAIALATHLGPLGPAPARTPAPIVTSPSASPTPSATASGDVPTTPLVLSRPAAQDVEHIVDTSGKVIATLTQPANVTWTVLAGPHHVVVLHDSTMTFYGASGAKLADDAFTPSNFSSDPLFTADGSRWVWTARLDPMAGPTNLYVGTQAAQLRRVAVHVDAPGQRLIPVKWVGGKVYLTAVQVVGGGRFQVPANVGAWVLDPTTGSLTRAAPDSCNFQDVGVDGTLLCVGGQQQQVTLVRSDGSTRTLTVPGSWGLIGPAAYTPDGTHVVVQAIKDDAVSVTTATFDGPVGGGEMTAVTGCLAAGLTDQAGPLVTCADGSVMLRSPDGALQPLKLPAGDTFHAVISDPRD